MSLVLEQRLCAEEQVYKILLKSIQEFICYHGHTQTYIFVVVK